MEKIENKNARIEVVDALRGFAVMAILLLHNVEHFIFPVYTASLLTGFGVFFLQVKCCKWWLGKHKQGPLEGIWHKWTWLLAKR